MNRKAARPWRVYLGRLGLVCTLALSSLGAAAANLQLQVTDASGRPLADTVVTAGWADAPDPAPDPKPATMAQHHLAFVPHVLVVPQYTQVAFPNQDKTRHHVYSFSPAKTFDIKLYIGRPQKPIYFGTPGVVTLGCNIHDQMQGYIVVTADPRWAKTDASGHAVLSDVPDSELVLSFWHPWMESEQTRVTRRISASDRRVRIALDVTAPPAPAASGRSSLQDQFNRLAH